MKKQWLIFLTVLMGLISGKLIGQATIANIPRILTPGGIFDRVFDRFGTEHALADLNLRSARFGNNTYSIATVPTQFCTAGKFKLFFSPNSIIFCQGTQSMAAQSVLCEVYSNISGFITSTISAGSINIFCDDAVGFLGLATSFYAFPGSPSNNNQGVVDGLIYKALTTGLDPYNSIPISSFNTGTIGSGFYHGAVYANPYAPFNFSLSTPTITSSEYLFFDVMLHEAVHTLGFASLINVTGASKFIGASNSYSRYDQFLTAANGIPLLGSSGSNSCPNNNLAFSVALTASNTISQSATISASTDGTTNCSSAVQYSSSNTVSKVYTPSVFEPASSLSHFEDMCTWGNSFTTSCVPTATPGYNDLYFSMSNYIKFGNCYDKRYLKQEEKQVLCDLGYTFSGSTFTSNAFGATHNYSSVCLPTATVIGINDGYSNGVFTFNTNTTQTVIPFSALVSNDIPITVSVSCLELIYSNTASLILGASDFTISSTVGAGMITLKYLPINTLGQIGNATYVYINFLPGLCVSAGTCNLIQNPGFETLSSGNPSCGIVYGLPLIPPSTDFRLRLVYLPGSFHITYKRLHRE